MPKTRKIPGASLRRDGTPGRGVRLDPRAKLASIAAMAVAVAGFALSLALGRLEKRRVVQQAAAPTAAPAASEA